MREIDKSYRRGFDAHHIFSVDEFYWEDRPRYYAGLDAVRREGEDLTGWREYCAEGLQLTLERVWTVESVFYFVSGCLPGPGRLRQHGVRQA
jgi:hypothetical protein